MPKTDLPVISLFTGGMGLDLGLERAGFRIAVAVECNRYAVATIRRNRPDIPVIERKIEDVTTEEILEKAGLTPGDALVVSGGPSCQVFSTVGGRGSFGDPRGTMFHEFLRVVRESQPRFFVMENVAGLLSAAVRHRPLNERGPGREPLSPDEQLGSAFRVVTEELRKLGYFVRFDLLNAADYGVPQIRHRLVFLGSRFGDAIDMPAKTHAHLPEPGRLPWRTLRDAVGELNEENPEFYFYCPSKHRYLKLVPPGGNWRDLPTHLQAEALGSAHVSWGGRSGFYRRLDWDEPSPALTTRPDSKATSLCHPAELRPLTVREYALIQQFDRDWNFEGPIRQKYQQVGNAVPVGLGAAIGAALRRAMRRRQWGHGLGKIECANLDLLVRLARRPITIVNPPRMRGDEPGTKLTEWLEGRTRFRTDTLSYAAPQIRDELTRLISAARPKRSVCDEQRRAVLSPASEGEPRDKDARQRLRLAAAE